MSGGSIAGWPSVIEMAGMSCKKVIKMKYKLAGLTHYMMRLSGKKVITVYLELRTILSLVVFWKVMS